MSRHVSAVLVRQCILKVLVLAIVLLPTAARAQTSPTASEDPVAVDQEWQEASAKYDGARATILKDVDLVDHQGPFRPDWESIEKYEVPEWYKDAKFGIFIHWDVYSVPAFGSEWYPRDMYRPAKEARRFPTTSPMCLRRGQPVNGEAIYGTRPWRIYGEGPTKVASGSFHDTDTATYTANDFRFTTKGGALYAIELGWPAASEVVVQSLAAVAGAQKIKAVELLGSNAKLQFHQLPDGLHIQTPAQSPGKYAYAYRILFE
jgi:Alpha-L-fucosidase/Alpha-L-fucosidase C-terminal domain